MRKATVGVIIAALSFLTISSLSGCAPSPESCTDGLPSSTIAKSITSADAQDALPTTTTFATPLVATTMSAAELVQGDGALVQKGDVVTATVTIFDGASGQAINGGQITLQTDGGDLPMLDGAVCAHVGSRVAVVGPASALLSTYTSGFGVDDAQTLVMTLDIDGAYLGRAHGTAVLPQNGLPTVSLAPDGRPGVSFTGDTAPIDLRTETLIKGSGDTVKDGDQVVVQYTGIDYSTHGVFDSTWDKGRPAILGTGDVVPGFSQAIIGATVGSQVLVVIPPADGYGANPPDGSGITPTSTLVFVIDILGIAPPAPSEE